MLYMLLSVHKLREQHPALFRSASRLELLPEIRMLTLMVGIAAIAVTGTPSLMTVSTDPPRPPPVRIPFADRMVDIPPVKLRGGPEDPTPVRTISIQTPDKPAATAPAPRPPIVNMGPIRPPPVRAKRRASRLTKSDICRGKGRYYINGGRSWRCRR